MTPGPTGPVDALLFDLGGVVLGIDFHRVFTAWARAAGRDPADVAAAFAFDEAFHRHERGELDDAGWFAHVDRRLGLGLGEAAMAAGWAEIFTGPVPGMHALLERARRLRPTYLFSNTNPAHHRQFGVEYAAQLAPFERCFLSFEIGARKPEARAFDAVARAIGVPAGRILFVDDTDANVEGARAAGLLAERVRSADDARAALARHGLELP
ncbi:MAG: HAD family phosphatase [Burkholderiales bacterium]|jgi:putative hydrolase of the HAD superfamily